MYVCVQCQQILKPSFNKNNFNLHTDDMTERKKLVHVFKKTLLKVTLELKTGCVLICSFFHQIILLFSGSATQKILFPQRTKFTQMKAGGMILGRMP